jgi:S1-C subfamily serine protease
VADVTASLATQDKGVFTDANFDGNIGSAWLKRFVVTFDYSRRTMYLDPIADPGDDVGTFDRSGMWLNLGDGGFVVAEVADGGPAAQAGLKADDVVVTLDGKPVADMLLPDARRLLRTRPAGNRIGVAYRRGGARHEATLVLRDQVPPKALPPTGR